jgi:hypothetical protein
VTLHLLATALNLTDEQYEVFATRDHSRGSCAKCDDRSTSVGVGGFQRGSFKEGVRADRAPNHQACTALAVRTVSTTTLAA